MDRLFADVDLLVRRGRLLPDVLHSVRDSVKCSPVLPWLAIPLTHSQC